METLASLKLKIDSSEAAPAAMGLDKLTAAGAKAEGQINKTASAASTLAKEEGRAAAATDTLAKTIRVQEEALQRATAAAAGLSASHAKVAAAGKVTTTEMLNLSRQFSDIAVTAAMGMNPLMILIQQGPQIADVFQTASQRGLGFSAVMRDIGISLGVLNVTAAATTVAISAEAEAQIAAAAASQASIASVVSKTAANIQAAKTEYALAQAQLLVAGSADAVVAAQVRMIAAEQAIVAASTEATIAQTALVDANATLAASYAAVEASATGAAAAETVALAPLAVALAAVAALAAGVGAGFLLMNRELQKGYPKDITDGLNLTAEQLKRVKERSVTTWDTFRAAIDVSAKYLNSGPLGDALKGFSDGFTRTMDAISKGAFNTVATIVGGFIGAVDFIRYGWANFPAALGDIFTMAANKALDAIQKLVNGASDPINKMLTGLNEIISRTGGQFSIPLVPTIDLGAFKGQITGAAEFTGRSFGIAIKNGIDNAKAGLQSLGSQISEGALAIARKRALEKAGDPNKTSSNSANGPANDYAQRIEALNAQLAQAKAAELQAQLSVVTDITARAALEHEILDAQTAAKMAGLDKQAAETEAARVAGKITDTQARVLGIRLQELTFMETAIAMAKGREIDDKAAQALHKQTYAQQASGLQNQIDLLTSQEQMLGTEYERQAVEEKILALQQQLERSKYEEVITSKASSEAAVNEAKARLATLEQIHANETYLKKHGGSLADAMQELTDALGGAASALMRGDWASALSSLSASMKALAKTMGMAGNKLLGSIGNTLSTASAGLTAGQGLGLGTGSGTADALLSIGGAAAGSALAGSALAGTIGAGIANGVIGLGGSAALAGTLGTMLSSAAVLGPIAVIAALAVGTLFKSKPSNNGALATLSDTSATLSGDKRTSETSTMATNAANAILQGEAILRNAGITLSTTVRSIDIGTRDATDIILSDGRQLNTAVGDAAAAAEAGLRAVVEGATFASAAQESLVKNMLAAGKGFDDIAAALNGYSNAQAVNDNIALQIKQLADPQGYDIEVLKASQKEQRDALQKLADAGYLAADQFQSASDQLTILEGLQLDEVLKKYNKAAADNSEITKTRADLEKQIFDLTHTSIEVRDAERQATLATLAAMDASLPALQARIYALNDEADAVAAATKAREDEDKRLQQIADDTQRRAEESAKAAADLQARRRSLEINLMEVSGDAAGALAAKRADELAAMDASLRPLQQAINAQADLNEANAKAADINEKAAAAAVAAAEKAAALVAKRVDLENQLLTAMGKSADVTTRTRAASLAALDPSLRSIQEATDALTDANAAVADAEQKVADKRSALTTAYEAESAAIKTTIDRFKTFTASLAAFREKLQTGDLANNAPAIQYARTKADFERVAGLAAQGNEQALGDLQGVSEAYLKASGDYQQTNVGYFRDLSAVKNATEAAAAYTSSQVDVAQAQLNALDASVAGLLTLNGSVLSVREAIGGLGLAISALASANAAKAAAAQAASAALTANAAAQAAANQQAASNAPVSIGANDNGDLAAAKAIYLAARGGVDSAIFDRAVGSDVFGTMDRVGYTGDPEALRKKWGFATGGSFTVGGPTSGDRVPVNFMANGGEHVNVSRSDNMARLADEIAALRAEVSALRNPMNRTADATERQTRILIAVTPNGDAIQTEAA